MLLAISCALLLVLARIYDTRYVQVIGDETWLVEVASNFRSSGVLGAPDFAGSGLGLEKYTYALPPVYPLALAGWFTLTGSDDLSSARLFSNLCALITLVCTWSIVCIYRPQTILPGLVALFLAIDGSFSQIVTWARPDGLALALALIGIVLYIRATNGRERIRLRLFIPALIAVSLAMLCHPLSGALGFFVIPLHVLIVRRQDRRRPDLWLWIGLIPAIGLLAWSSYIFRDPQTFIWQFVDWQISRKQNRHSGLLDWLKVAGMTLFNYGGRQQPILPIVWLGLLSAIILTREQLELRLLAVMIVLVTGAAVSYGLEAAYPPLRIPPMYLALALAFPGSGVALRSWAGAIPAWIPPLPLLRAVLICALVWIGGWSLYQDAAIGYEIRLSERAFAYDPATLAREIIDAVPAGSSLGFHTLPAVDDLLRRSDHFARLSNLSWNRLSPEQYQAYLLRNEYIAVTRWTVWQPGASPQSAFDLLSPGFIEILDRFYTEHRRIVLPNGHETIIYRRSIAPPVDVP